MNQKNPLSDAWIEREKCALRNDQPIEAAVDRAVSAMQAPPVRLARPRKMTLRLATGGVAVVALVTFLSINAGPVSAGEIDRLADAAKKQLTRHTRDMRPDVNGNLVLKGEYWTEGEKYRMEFHNEDGTVSVHGHTGTRSFHQTGGGAAYIDEDPPEGFPIETIEDYLAIPNANIKSVQRGVQQGNRKVDVFTIAFGSMSMELFIDPPSGLPIKRNVLSAASCSEENLYDYPADIPDEKFEIPRNTVNTTNYPALRQEFMKKVASPGQTKELNGVKITLYGVVIGKKQVIAIWEGGAKTDYDPENGHVHIVGLPQGAVGGMDTGTVRPYSDDGSRNPIKRKGKALIPDAIWYEDTTAAVKGPIKVRIPVWVEDPSRPLSAEDPKLQGNHSKLIGTLEFTVNDPMYADDPQRVLWPPQGWIKVKTASTPQS